MDNHVPTRHPRLTVKESSTKNGLPILELLASEFP